jgi:integrase
MRTRTKGIQAAEDGGKVVNKQYRGQRIFARLGAVSQDEAESWLRKEQARLDVESRQGTGHLFCDAAERYLLECVQRKVRTINNIAVHVNLILPYIGQMSLQMVHTGSLQAFCRHRIEVDGVSASTVNYTLIYVRTILNRAAKLWRNEDGSSWLGSPPHIELLDTNPRKPYPMTWVEQARLFKELPPHLERMALFAVNTGLRDKNVCHLKWEWERRLPELGRSVFLVPAASFKSARAHVAILNDVATEVIESMRGNHPDYVFAYRNGGPDKPAAPIFTMNNSGWCDARKRAGVERVRVHDLRHTYGQRLRDAGVPEEDRAVLLGHRITSMAGHYATPTIARLIEQANSVRTTRDTPTLLRVVNG